MQTWMRMIFFLFFFAFSSLVKKKGNFLDEIGKKDLKKKRKRKSNSLDSRDWLVHQKTKPADKKKLSCVQTVNVTIFPLFPTKHSFGHFFSLSTPFRISCLIKYDRRNFQHPSSETLPSNSSHFFSDPIHYQPN